MARDLTAFRWGERTYIMGVLNATPDSFSGDGVLDVAAAAAAAEQMVSDGADIIDIGAESTRPDGTPVSGEEERARLLPVIAAVRRAVTVPISADTYRADTAAAALSAGADWINDVWGLQRDPRMAAVVAAAGCPLVIMHNGRNRPRHDRDDSAGGYYGYFHYDDLLGEIVAELAQAVAQAEAAGIDRSRIIVDPGVGFGKTGAQNLTLVDGLAALKGLNRPILLGTSRKGFIGHALGGLPAGDRVEGTAATVAIGIDRGADIVRVHDVRAMARVARMTDALVRGRARHAAGAESAT